MCLSGVGLSTALLGDEAQSSVRFLVTGWDSVALSGRAFLHLVLLVKPFCKSGEARHHSSTRSPVVHVGGISP
jgi:hypothetical protein